MAEQAQYGSGEREGIWRLVDMLKDNWNPAPHSQGRYPVADFFGGGGAMDLLDTPLSEAISPWMAMKRTANTQKANLWDKTAHLRRMWQAEESHGARNELAKILATETPEELRKVKLAKLAKETDVRKHPDGGREFLLYRGFGSQEKEKLLETGGVLPWTASFTPNPKTADMFGFPWVTRAWVPEQHIAGYLNQLGSYSTVGGRSVPGFRGEKEVIVPEGARAAVEIFDKHIPDWKKVRDEAVNLWEMVHGKIKPKQKPPSPQGHVWTATQSPEPLPVELPFGTLSSDKVSIAQNIIDAVNTGNKSWDDLHFGVKNLVSGYLEKKYGPQTGGQMIEELSKTKKPQLDWTLPPQSDWAAKITEENNKWAKSTLNNWGKMVVEHGYDMPYFNPGEKEKIEVFLEQYLNSEDAKKLANEFVKGSKHSIQSILDLIKPGGPG